MTPVLRFNLRGCGYRPLNAPSVADMSVDGVASVRAALHFSTLPPDQAVAQ